MRAHSSKNFFFFAPNCFFECSLGFKKKKVHTVSNNSPVSKNSPVSQNLLFLKMHLFGLGVGWRAGNPIPPAGPARMRFLSKGRSSSRTEETLPENPPGALDKAGQSCREGDMRPDSEVPTRVAARRPSGHQSPPPGPLPLQPPQLQLWSPRGMKAGCGSAGGLPPRGPAGPQACATVTVTESPRQTPHNL